MQIHEYNSSITWGKKTRVSDTNQHKNTSNAQAMSLLDEECRLAGLPLNATFGFLANLLLCYKH